MTKKELSGEIRTVPIGFLKPYGRNPRRIPDSAVALVAESITRFGWKQLIVAGADGEIAAGHTRYAAALQLGLKEVPCLISPLSKSELRAYRLTDNRSHELSDWEKEDLAAELKALTDLGVDPLGFEDDVRALLAAEDEEEAATHEVTFEARDEGDAAPQVCPTCGQTLADDA